MVEWHHPLDGHEFEETLGVGDCHIKLHYPMTKDHITKGNEVLTSIILYHIFLISNFLHFLKAGANVI